MVRRSVEGGELEESNWGISYRLTKYRKYVKPETKPTHRDQGKQIFETSPIESCSGTLMYATTPPPTDILVLCKIGVCAIVESDVRVVGPNVRNYHEPS
jgi:hypothetical protein